MISFNSRLTVIALLLAVVGNLQAIVVVNDSGSTSQQEPTQPGWSHTGELNSGTGVYLGDGWVLTANHVGAGTLSLPIWDPTNQTQSFVSYTHDPSTVCRVQNPSNPMAEWGVSDQIVDANGDTYTMSTNTDMLVFRLNSMPPLSSLSIPTVSSAPSLNDTVTLISTGRVLDASTISIEGTSVGPTGNPVRWGTNEVINAVPGGVFGFANSGNGDVYSFATSFDDPSGAGLTTEAQAQNGDSGGATFAAGSSTLLGLIHAVIGDANSTAFDDWTILASIAHYYEYTSDSNRSISSCMTAVTPVPEPGAFTFILTLVFGLSTRQWLKRRELNSSR